MEADWDEVQRIILPPPGPNAHPTPATTISFDNAQELLWAGNEHGRVTSFYGAELQKYTSYRGHAAGEGQVRQLLFCEKGILSVASQSVHLSSRRGIAIWHITQDDMVDLRCMSFTMKGTTEILVAGGQSQMYRIDVDKGVISHTISTDARYNLMKRGGQSICAATMDGTVHILDPGTCNIIRHWRAHSGFVSDMDVRSEMLVTCGYSPRPQQGLTLDRLVNVFDLKTLMPLPPVPFPPGAAFVRMHPKMSTTCVVSSMSGLIYTMDIMNSDSPQMKHANIMDTQLTAIDLAPSGEALVLTDAQCAIHLWGSPNKIQITEYSNPTEFADTIEQMPTLDWAPEVPLNVVGMPFYRDTLLSAWPSHIISEVGAPLPKMDTKIVSSLKRDVIGGYAPWPRKTRRYQVEDTRAVQRAQDSLAAPRFLSEKAKENKDDKSPQNGDRRISDALEILGDLVLDGSTRREVPVIYRNVEIKYSKFGVEDFDFEYYNKTKHSGLETHIANSYTNPLLQLFRFVPTIRNLTLHHTATSCLYDNCLLCELGFLIDMMEKAAGLNCQASNFLKVFSSLSDAATLGLLEEHAHNNPLTAMIQGATRFLLKSFSDSFRQLPPHNRYMEQALTTGAYSAIRCGHCANEMLKPGESFVHDLVYPTKTIKHHPRAPKPSFSQILKSSVERQDQTRGWCDRCKRYQQLSTRKTIQTTPKVMMINAAIHTMDQKQLWSTPGWMPQEVGVIVTGGQFYCYEGQDLKLHLQRGVYDITVYELVGLVADVHSGENQKPHLISLVNVSISSPEPTKESKWHLFNDFLVRQVTTAEALRFDASWKLPAVLAFQAKSASNVIDDSWKENLDPALLFHLPRGPHKPPEADVLRALSSTTESPRPGVPVAIDAEFVALSRAEIDIKADGTRETVRPSRLGLARVSVLRGAGPHEGLPFIDDYIAIPEPVVDYLTAFSGISPGDLDRSTSKQNLVSLKVAYKKLWLLLNLGVVFVGHGLPKDFRTINIHIPKSQVVDTVDLFARRMISQRRLSLRFLAWYVLREDIQNEGEKGHDSVEDARTALKLWRKYQEYVDAGVLESMLDEIFDRGRDTGFKPPSVLKAEREGDVRPETPTTSLPGTPARRIVSVVGAQGRPGFASPLR